MILTVTLLRHAKSSWGDKALADFDRPLSERGVRDAPRMAKWLRAEGVAPELVLCSTAQRTQQTLALIRPTLPNRCTVQLTKSLYMADVRTLLTAIRGAPETVRHIMLIGHNPGLEDAARTLVGAGDQALRAAMAAKFPSAGCAMITFDAAQWSAVAARAGVLTRWMTPRGLPA